MAQTVAF